MIELVIEAGQVVAPLIVALITALGAVAVGWRRLTVLGNAERGKLEAQKQDIIQTAEDRATARALEALKMTVDVMERERDRALADAADTRKSLHEAQFELTRARAELLSLRDRLSKLEAIVEVRDRHISELRQDVNTINGKHDDEEVN